MDERQTIAAIATAAGAGGIAIVRLSGPGAGDLLKAMFRPARARDGFESHRLMYGRAVDADGCTIDEVMAVFMRAPSTYTREDVAEIHCHGGRVSAQAVLDRALGLGAQMAQPGEFTKRAFLNGRIDLSEAEAVMQLIGAQSEAAARASVRQLEGGVSGFVRGVSERLTGLLALIEASTDFPDEVEEEAAAEQLLGALRGIIQQILERCDMRRARLIREGASIVLAGRPNVGKSSLMNALLERERAIVTDIPGTTRDVLTERVILGGVAAELSDTAGLRDTDDPIERIGVDRARRATDSADILLIVIDTALPLSEGDITLLKCADERAMVCLNKTDLQGVVRRDDVVALTNAPVYEVSAQTGAGLQALVDEMTRRVGVDEERGGQLVARRHIELSRAAVGCLEQAMRTIEAGLPLDTAAIDLKEALEKLGEITGENATEAVIDRIFADFCVGK